MMRPARSGHEKPGVSERVASMMVITRSVTDGYPHCRPSARVKTSGPGPRPELRIPDVAAQTRTVSVARIGLDSRKFVRPFKQIICGDISEFESYHPSQAVRKKRIFVIARSKRQKGWPNRTTTSWCGKFVRSSAAGTSTDRPATCAFHAADRSGQSSVGT
jgi:hypothetical protein